MKPDAESSEEEWEEVEESKNVVEGSALPSESVEVTVNVPDTIKKKWNKKDWEREMVEASIRRAIKKFAKDTQLDMHKVHLLSLLALGMRLNKVCNDEQLLATVFSLLPERYTTKTQNHVSAIFLTRFLKDFIKVFHFDNGIENLLQCRHTRQPKMKSLLLKVLERKIICFRIDIVVIVVLALRAMGLETRLVLSLQPIQLKVLTEKQKESASKPPKSIKKKANPVKNQKSDDDIPQVDGPSDTPPRRLTRSVARRSGNIKNAPPLTGKRQQEKIKDNGLPPTKFKHAIKKDENICKKSKVTLKRIAVPKTKQTLCVPDEATDIMEKIQGVDETPISKPLLKSKVKKRLSATPRNVKKRRIKLSSEEKQSEDEFDAMDYSDSDDSDFKIQSKKVTKSIRKSTTASRKSTANLLCSNNDSVKPKKVNSRRSTGNVKKVDNDCSDDAWVEVYSDQEKRWLCIDVFRNMINHPEKMEQYATKPLHYVIGLDHNSHVKDITARYASKWLTETRKLRVGIADKDWWKNTLAPYATSNKDRDFKENQDMQQKLLSQPTPTSISAFKNHPLFALRRHMLKYEALYPPDIPALGLIRGEEIFPRSAIHTLHTRDKWLQEARVVEDGEEPYKMVASMWINMKLKQDMSTLSMPLFGVWQTKPFVPPIAENGEVPRNRYGNVDLFKPEMIPVGCVKISLPGIKKLARKLNIDIAAAVTGFDSHSGYPHPVTDGYVICAEYEQILKDAWKEDQIHAAEREQKKREERIYGAWKLLIKGALAKERISRKYCKQAQDCTAPKENNIRVENGTAWQSKRLQEARSKSGPRKRGRRPKENLLPFETETL